MTDVGLVLIGLMLVYFFIFFLEKEVLKAIYCTGGPLVK